MQKLLRLSFLIAVEWSGPKHSEAAFSLVVLRRCDKVQLIFPRVMNIAIELDMVTLLNTIEEAFARDVCHDHGD